MDGETEASQEQGLWVDFLSLPPSQAPALHPGAPAPSELQAGKMFLGSALGWLQGRMLEGVQCHRALELNFDLCQGQRMELGRASSSLAHSSWVRSRAVIPHRGNCGNCWLPLSSAALISLPQAPPKLLEPGSSQPGAASTQPGAHSGVSRGSPPTQPSAQYRFDVSACWCPSNLPPTPASLSSTMSAIGSHSHSTAGAR